jgi:hypothetical protein
MSITGFPFTYILLMLCPLGQWKHYHNPFGALSHLVNNDGKPLIQAL